MILVFIVEQDKEFFQQMIFQVIISHVFQMKNVKQLGMAK